MVYLICVTYYFTFFSVIATFFWRRFLYFQTQCFDYSNSLVPIPFNRLGQSHMWKSRSDAYYKIIFLDNMTTMSLLTFDFASVVSHYKATYDTHSFLISQLSCFFCIHYKWLTFWGRRKKFLQIQWFDYLITWSSMI